MHSDWTEYGTCLLCTLSLATEVKNASFWLVDVGEGGEHFNRGHKIISNSRNGSEVSVRDSFSGVRDPFSDLYCLWPELYIA